MSALMFDFPVEMVFPIAKILLGLGVAAMFLVVFRPLVLGILRAVVLFVKPRKTLDQCILQHRFNGMSAINRMANEYSHSQPNFAAELRNLATRD